MTAALLLVILNGFGKIPVRDDGYSENDTNTIVVPTSAACRAAADLLDKLVTSNCTPDDFYATLDNGFRVNWSKNSRYASLEIDEEGDAFLAIFDSESDPIVYPVESTCPGLLTVMYVVRNYLETGHRFLREIAPVTTDTSRAENAEIYPHPELVNPYGVTLAFPAGANDGHR